MEEQGSRRNSQFLILNAQLEAFAFSGPSLVLSFEFLVLSFHRTHRNRPADEADRLSGVVKASEAIAGAEAPAYAFPKHSRRPGNAYGNEPRAAEVPFSILCEARSITLFDH